MIDYYIFLFTLFELHSMLLYLFDQILRSTGTLDAYCIKSIDFFFILKFQIGRIKNNQN